MFQLVACLIEQINTAARGFKSRLFVLTISKFCDAVSNKKRSLKLKD